MQQLQFLKVVNISIYIDKSNLVNILKDFQRDSFICPLLSTKYSFFCFLNQFSHSSFPEIEGHLHIQTFAT